MHLTHRTHRLSRHFLQPLAAIALLATASAAQAALTVYTSQAAFLAAVSAPGVDSFSNLSNIGVATPAIRNAGVYSYRISVSPSGSIFGAGTPANPWLSTVAATDTVTFSNFAAGVSALGGNFFGSDLQGAFFAGSVTLAATDSFGAGLTQRINNATTTSFLGFVSNGSLSTVTLTAVQATNPAALWATADNLTLAQAVPEPASYAMVLGGLAVLVLRARRRKL